MDKKAKKKPLFLMKETLVNLTPGEMGRVHGGCLGTGMDTFDLSKVSKCIVIIKPGFG